MVWPKYHQILISTGKSLYITYVFLLVLKLLFLYVLRLQGSVDVYIPIK